MLKKRKHEIHQQVDSPISEKDNVPKDFDFRSNIKFSVCRVKPRM